MKLNLRRGVALVVGLAALGSVSEARAQDVLEGLEALAQENAEAYIDPVAVGLGVALNAGFHQTGSTHEFLGFDLGIRVMGALPPSNAKTFAPVLPGSVTFGGVTYDQPYEPIGTLLSPTAMGDGDGLVIQPRAGGAYYDALVAAGLDPSDYQVRFPEGTGLPAVPFVALQGSLGIGMGTDVTIRYMPSLHVHDDVGDVSAFGYGVKHSLTQWLPSPSPVDVAVTAGWQSLTVGRYLDATASNFGVIASVQQGPITLYALGRRERASIDVSYSVDNPEGNPALPGDGVAVAFSNELRPEIRVAGGFTLRVVGLDLSAEYAFADYNTVAAKAGISVN